VVLAIALVALAVVGSFTLRWLGSDGTEETTTSRIETILDQTTQRTEQGSQFSPPSISSPLDWPYAVVRTLTRPLPIEARGAFQLASAAEMVLFAAFATMSWRRLARVPATALRVPFVAFAVTVLVLAGLAYSSFANLGILIRQKSLVMPFLLLLACVPARPGPGQRAATMPAMSSPASVGLRPTLTPAARRASILP
jgi:hypothetical protein